MRGEDATAIVAGWWQWLSVREGLPWWWWSGVDGGWWLMKMMRVEGGRFGVIVKIK